MAAELVLEMPRAADPPSQFRRDLPGREHRRNHASGVVDRPRQTRFDTAAHVRSGARRFWTFLKNDVLGWGIPGPWVVGPEVGRRIQKNRRLLSSAC